MTLDIDLTIYLLIFGLVDQTLMAPAPVRADLNDHESSLKPTSEDRYDLLLWADDVNISKYREDDIDKYHVENRQFKRDTDGSGTNNEEPSVAERIYGDEVGSSSARNYKDSGEPTGFQSVPFETVATITRDNVPEAAQASLDETRQATDESLPCHEKEYSVREIPGKPKSPTKAKDTSWKRRLTGIVNFMRALRKTVRKRENMKLEAKDNESTTTEPENADEEFTDDFADTPINVFTDKPSKQEKNETSQRQELDGDEEESEGSLGSLTDFLPVVLPVLQDLSDPNSSTDLAALLEAALPLVGGFLNPEDPDAPNIIQTIVSAVSTVLGGPDGQGLDFAGLVGPLLQIAGPFIIPIGGPILTYAIRTLTNPDALLSIIRSVLGAVTQAGPDGTPAILNAVVDFVVSLIGDLNPGAAGGLDVAAIVQAVTTGTLTALTGYSSGGKFDAKPYGPYAPYGPYGTGPVPAASVNSLQTSPSVVVPPPQTNSFKRTTFLKKQPIAKAANDVLHHAIRLRTSRRPQFNPPKKPNQRPPPQFQNFFPEFGTSPVFAANTGNGGATYSPYGNYVPQYGAVPANGVNPLALIFSSLQNVTSDGIQLVASLINASFGISGASSIDSGPPASYGPPAPYKPPATYG